MTRTEWYARVNAAWPAEVPKLTAAEAVKAARRLWRWGMGETMKGKIEVTSGRRYNWSRDGVLYVNPDRGWHGLVHDLSHLMWRRANWNAEVKPHERDHAKFELRMRKEVLKRGYLAGALKDKPKPEKPEVDPRVKKYRSIVVRMDSWLAKKNRAERALAKLVRQRKYYERVGIAA